MSNRQKKETDQPAPKATMLNLLKNRNAKQLKEVQDALDKHAAAKRLQDVANEKSDLNENFFSSLINKN